MARTTPTALWDASNGWSSPNLRNGQTFLNGSQINGTVTGLPSDYALVDVVTSGGGTQANALANDRNLAGRQGGQQIGEVILFNSALGSLDRVKTEAYLAAKWFAQGGPTNNVLPAGTPVAMSGGGRLDLSGFNQTIGSLAATDASGTQVLLGAGRLTVGGANHTSFDGALTISGPNLSYTGITTIADGTHNLDGPIGGGANIVNANGGTTNFHVSQTLAKLNIAHGAGVTLEAAVPEPGTAGLLLLGALGLLGRRARK